MFREEDLVCECGEKLQWNDTIDMEGGIDEGYIQEKQLLVCPKCDKGYIAVKFAQIKTAQILEFEEDDD